MIYLILLIIFASFYMQFRPNLDWDSNEEQLLLWYYKYTTEINIEGTPEEVKTREYKILYKKR